MKRKTFWILFASLSALLCVAAIHHRLVLGWYDLISTPLRPKTPQERGFAPWQPTPEATQHLHLLKQEIRNSLHVLRTKSSLNPNITARGEVRPHRSLLPRSQLIREVLEYDCMHSGSACIAQVYNSHCYLALPSTYVHCVVP